MNSRFKSMAPGPATNNLLGHIGELKEHYVSTTAAWHERYGNLVRFRLGPKTCFLVNHPSLAEQILITEKDIFLKIHDSTKPRGLGLVLGNGLLTSTGAHWQSQRRIMQPVFHRSQIAKMTDSITLVGQQLIDRWSLLDPDVAQDISVQMMRVTLEVITQTMFGSSVQSQYQSLAPAFQVISEYAQNSFINPLTLPLFIPTPANRAFKRAVVTLQEIIIDLIRQRQNSTEKKEDLLDLLLGAQDAHSGEGMSMQQIIDESLTIFSAGHETTANALTWVWYLLAKNPDVLELFHAEIDRVVAGRTPGFEDLTKLTYTRAVLEEALRLYPPAVAVFRKTSQPAVLAGYAVPKGALVMVNIRNIHRHPDFWQSPLKFDPNRMLGDNRVFASRLAFMPFGAGPRVCIGSHFAMNEAILLMVQIASRYRFELATNNPVQEQMKITLRPSGGLPMYIKARQSIQ